MFSFWTGVTGKAQSKATVICKCRLYCALSLIKWEKIKCKKAVTGKRKSIPKLHSRGRFLHYGQWIGERPPSAQQRLRVAIGEALAKKPADFEAFLRLMGEAGYAVKYGRGGVISFLVPGQDRPTRLRASTLGEGYDPADIRAVIAGERPVFEGYKAVRYSKKYLAEHESELDTYRAAKAAMNDLLAGGKLPKMDALKKSAGSWPKRKRPSTENTARPSGRCGRPWPPRATSTTCSV